MASLRWQPVCRPPVLVGRLCSPAACSCQWPVLVGSVAWAMAPEMENSNLKFPLLSKSTQVARVEGLLVPEELGYSLCHVPASVTLVVSLFLGLLFSPSEGAPSK